MADLFQKHEHVAYGNIGICWIEDIQPLSFTPRKALSRYYVLRPVGNQTETIFVPCHSNALVSKMRHALTKTEIDALLLEMKDKELQWVEDKNARSALFHGILAKGDRQALIQMTHCILLQKQERATTGKKLAVSDEGALKTAEKLVEEEFSFSLHIPAVQVSAYIRGQLAME